MRGGRVLGSVLSQGQDLHQRVARAAQLEGEPSYILRRLRAVTFVVLLDRADPPISEYILRRERASTAAIRASSGAVVARNLTLPITGQAGIVFLLGSFHGRQSVVQNLAPVGVTKTRRD